MTDPKNLSEAIQNMEHDRHVDRRQKWWLFTVSGLLFVAVVVIAVLAWQLSLDRDASKREAATEQQQKQEYAQELQTVLCEKGDVEIYDADRCAELTAVATEPTAGVIPRDGKDGRDGRDGVQGPVGPQGPQGPEGPEGSQGLAGLLGQAGADGLNGLNGADGLQGPAGSPGPEGPAGPAGTDGTDGAPGAPGRGIAAIVCEGTGDSSYWVVSYDDGTTQTSDGPCRLTSIPIPTEAP
ncbi:collagen-like protein [Arthrobacter sp. zg-Y859]|uniref:Collagen-like protein n=1 Tax=Arthrobacter jinronghuae TaxID=2964609 RepID=A0ABT1NY46_9MICC|nr:collagen-like protein [Arthrobacter jinronghuae]MCQ1951629.1 collagen-like protein [Arthrobacter jinronghuae]UWX79657.1 collagen-like protein [Arthrobacter jinronghuae]